MLRKDYIGIYGNVNLRKSWCVSCQQMAIVLRGLLQCCEKPIDCDPQRFKRESIAEQRRHLPPAEDRRAQLKMQENRCIYCERQFGSRVYRKMRLVRLRICWDHFVPYALMQDNRAVNFVAACHLCNSWKSDKVFQTLTDARLYLYAKWRSEVLE
jgi:hypothetical protein